MFPYRDDQAQEPVPESAPNRCLIADYEAQIEAELQRMIDSEMIPRPPALM